MSYLECSEKECNATFPISDVEADAEVKAEEIGWKISLSQDSNLCPYHNVKPEEKQRDADIAISLILSALGKFRKGDITLIDLFNSMYDIQAYYVTTYPPYTSEEEVFFKDSEDFTKRVISYVLAE